MKKYKSILSNVGLAVTILYGSINFVCLFSYDFFDYEKISGFVEFVLGLDIYSWHIYGAFSVLTFLLSLNNESREKRKYIFYLLHITFLLISFICIWNLFEYSF